MEDVTATAPDASGCGQEERLLSVRGQRFCIHDAAERNDVPLLSKLLLLEDDDDYDPTAPHRNVALDKNERDNHGCTPLHVAALYRSAECFGLLVDSGVKLNIKCNGSPLLHLLLSLGAIPENTVFMTEAIGRLLVATIDHLALDDLQRTWLHVAATNGGEHVSERILLTTEDVSPKVGSVRDARDKFGRTALHCAAASRDMGMLSMLIGRGADADVCDTIKGDTAAHSAARIGWSDGMTALLAQMSEPTRPNFHGASAADLLRAAPVGKTLLLTHAACKDHHTCAPITRQLPYVPPENTGRLETLFHPTFGALQSAVFREGCETAFGAPSVKVRRGTTLVYCVLSWV